MKYHFINNILQTFMWISYDVWLTWNCKEVLHNHRDHNDRVMHAFQTGCQLSSAATGMSLELRFLARFQWREAYVLDNWQLAELPQSGGREFDPRRVHDNSSVPLWVYMRFPVPEHPNQTNKYVYNNCEINANS